MLVGSTVVALSGVSLSPQVARVKTRVRATPPSINFLLISGFFLFAFLATLATTFYDFGAIITAD